MAAQGFNLQTLESCSGHKMDEKMTSEEAARVLSDVSVQGYWSVALDPIWMRSVVFVFSAGSIFVFGTLFSNNIVFAYIGVASITGYIITPLIAMIMVRRKVLVSLRRAKSSRCSVCDYPLNPSGTPATKSQPCTECGNAVLSLGAR